jgi:para-nitrobenzyl esterase
MRSDILAVALLLFAACRSDQAPEVTTPVGTFVGARTGEVDVFLGIRYAAPPVGDLRWRPPVAADPMDGPVDATAYGPAAPQVQDDLEGASTAPQSEDCLSLNVFAPRTDGPHPVLVFLHGGGWSNGGTVDSWYDATRLAAATDLVVVTVNYRLGPLGFLDLSVLGGEPYAGSGNLGLLDQQLALAWVHDHIAAFGGDADAVTLSGQSAGGQSVALHLTLPDSRAHFQRAIAMSGALALLHSPTSAQGTAARFAELLGASDIDELRAATVDEILAAQASLEEEVLFADALYGPVLDGVVLTEPPIQAIARGDASSIPLLHGTTLDETRMWYYYAPFLTGVPPRLAAPLLPFEESLLDDAGMEALISGYEARHPDESPPGLTMRLATDALYLLPQLRLAEAHAAADGTNFLYRFDFPSTVEGGLYGALHSIDLPFLFRNFADPSVAEFVGDAPPAALLDTYTSMVEAFVRTGSPQVAALPVWEPYATDTRSTLLFDLHPAVAPDPNGDDRAAWHEIPFDGVTPSL